MAEVVHEEESITPSLKLGTDGDVVKKILGPYGVFQCLQKDLPVDNDLASQLYEWNLLPDTSFIKIRALNNNGEPQEAFVHWHTYALNYYTGESLNNLCKCLRRVGKNAKPLLIEVAKKIEEAIRRVNYSKGGRHLKLPLNPNPHHRYPDPCSPGPRTPGPIIPEPGSPGYGPYDVPPKNRQPGNQSIKRKPYVRMLSNKPQEDECLMSLPIVEQVHKSFKTLIDAVKSHVCNCEDLFALRHHCRKYLEQLLSGHIPSHLLMLPEAKQEVLDGTMKYWNALSYGLLEAIAKHLQVKKLDKKLDEYKRIVAQSVTTTLGECEWKQVKMFRAQYLKVTYSEDPNKFELSRVLEFQEFLEKRCGINRSLFVGAEKGSVILFFLIPHEDADRLHSKVDYSILSSLQVCCIEFQGEWQRIILTPTEELKCQDKVYDCVNAAILSLAYDEWKNDQCKVCYDMTEWESFKESLLITYTLLNSLKRNSSNTAKEDYLFPDEGKMLKCQLKMKKTQSISILSTNSSKLHAIGNAIGKSSGAGAGVGMVAGGGVGAGLGAGIGATVGTVVFPCIGTVVGAVAGTGIGLFAGTVPGVVGGWGVVQGARRLFGRSPKDSKPLTMTAEEIFCKLEDFRKDGKDVYASIEIIDTVQAFKLEEYPAKAHSL